jgi:hypothetical protein
MWSYDCHNKLKSGYNYPCHGKVNNFQAVTWVSQFCKKYQYQIVISSTWRKDSDCSQILYNSGLDKHIKIIGSTPVLDGMQRGDEITAYLKEHPEITGYLIFDDDSDMTVHMDRLVKCNVYVGFTVNEYHQAVTLHQAFNKSKGSDIK